VKVERESYEEDLYFFNAMFSTAVPMEEGWRLFATLSKF
jgi:hypothetical protein